MLRRKKDATILGLSVTDSKRKTKKLFGQFSATTFEVVVLSPSYEPVSKLERGFNGTCVRLVARVSQCEDTLCSAASHKPSQVQKVFWLV